VDSAAAPLRARLQQLPALDESRLWKVQARAIHNLEASFAKANPRALIQMATGSGKTFTAVNIAYRLLKFGVARRNPVSRGPGQSRKTDRGRVHQL
jgi:type I restriction enzyme R subunit